MKNDYKTLMNAAYDTMGDIIRNAYGKSKCVGEFLDMASKSDWCFGIAHYNNEEFQDTFQTDIALSVMVTPHDNHRLKKVVIGIVVMSVRTHKNFAELTSVNMKIEAIDGVPLEKVKKHLEEHPEYINELYFDDEEARRNTTYFLQ